MWLALCPAREAAIGSTGSQPLAPDRFQPTLLRRSGFQRQVKHSVGLRGCDLNTLLHVLVYVKCQVGNGRGLPQQIGDFPEWSLTQPSGHGFGQPWLFRLVEDGQPLVIWLFSVLRYRDICLPPSLDARIEVKYGYSRGSSSAAPNYIQWLLSNYDFAFEPEPTRSFYLPWNNFTPAIQKSVANVNMPSVEAEVIPFSCYSRFMPHFQTPRRLSIRVSKVIEDFAREVRSMPEGFVSYRRRDAPILGMQTAARLYHHGVAPWWDQWAMPRKVAEEEALFSSGHLDTVLVQAISRARSAITLHTRFYGTPSSPWTKVEFERIQAANAAKPLTHVPLAIGIDFQSPEATKSALDQALLHVGLLVSSRVGGPA